MFPQFFAHPSLYPSLFQLERDGADAASGGNAHHLSLSSQLALLSNSAAAFASSNPFNIPAAALLNNAHNQQFFVDNLLRERAALAAVVASAHAHSPKKLDLLDMRQSSNQSSPNTATHSPHYHQHSAHNLSKSAEETSVHKSGRSSANASETNGTDHETESSHCDRNSDSSSPPGQTKSSQLKFGMNAILSNSKTESSKAYGKPGKFEGRARGALNRCFVDRCQHFI